MHDVRIPPIGEAMEVDILQWLVAVGQRVKKGDPLVEVESEKARLAIEAEVDGTVAEILAQDGAVVHVGDIIARIRLDE